MAKIKNDPPVGEIYESAVDYMLHASLPALGEIELRRLAEETNLRKTLMETVTELVRVRSEALLARTIRKMRQGEPLALGESGMLAHELLAEAIPELQEPPPTEAPAIVRVPPTRSLGPTRFTPPEQQPEPPAKVQKKLSEANRVIEGAKS